MIFKIYQMNPTFFVYFSCEITLKITLPFIDIPKENLWGKEVLSLSILYTQHPPLLLLFWESNLGHMCRVSSALPLSYILRVIFCIFKLVPK